MKCPTCGRFMKEGGYYGNEHTDSWTETWRCSQKHDHQIGSAYSSVAHPTEPHTSLENRSQ